MSSFSEQKWTTMNKNVRFISGNFSSERFSWKVKTIRCGLYILINKHQRYWCLEFTILKRTWPIFAETLISFSLEFRPKPFVYVPHKWLWSKILTNSFLWINKNKSRAAFTTRVFVNIYFYFMHGISICLVWHVMRYFVLFMFMLD